MGRMILRARGRNDFHVRAMSLSYRIRGRVARIQINRTDRRRADVGRSRRGKTIGAKKITEEKTHMIRMFTYSAMKRSAKRLAPNSILKPETSSDSPSAKSNGVRFVSARMVMNQIHERGRHRRKGGAREEWMICEKSKENNVIKREIRIRVIDTS